MPVALPSAAWNINLRSPPAAFAPIDG